MRRDVISTRYYNRRTNLVDSNSVIELQKNKCGGSLYPSFPQQHGPYGVVYGVVKISELPGILWLPSIIRTLLKLL